MNSRLPNWIKPAGPTPDEFLVLFDGCNPTTIPEPAEIIDFYAF